MIYSQASGKLFDSTGKLIGQGYAGNGQWKNDPDSQDVKDHGPLCRGWYTMTHVIDSPKTGPFSIVLVPDPNNEMFGRGDFLCHGDNMNDPGNGSDGCMVQEREVREQMWNGSDHRILVVR